MADHDICVQQRPKWYCLLSGSVYRLDDLASAPLGADASANVASDHKNQVSSEACRSAFASIAFVLPRSATRKSSGDFARPVNLVFANGDVLPVVGCFFL